MNTTTSTPDRATPPKAALRRWVPAVVAAAVSVLLLLPVTAFGQLLEANVNNDPEGDLNDINPFDRVVDFPAFLDILQSSMELTGDPGEEILVLRMTVAEPIDESALPTGPTDHRGEPDGIQHPGVISDVVWRFGLITDPSSVHTGFPYPPGPETRPELVNIREFLVDLAWDFEGFRADLVTSGVGPTDSLDFEISTSNDRGVIEISLPVALIGGMESLNNLHWTSVTLIGFGSPCVPAYCLLVVVDLNDPFLSFVLSE